MEKLYYTLSSLFLLHGRISKFISIAVFFIVFQSSLLAQVSLTTLGSPYTQDFNTLANTGTTNATLPTGWTLTETGGGARDNEQYAADDGGSSTGDTYSFGAAASTDRAFGGLQSGSLVPTIGASFTNNTGSTVTSLVISYTGEQWRIGNGNSGAARDDRMDFQYSTNATDLTTGTWTDVNSLDFTNPIKTQVAAAGALDGNAAANRTAISFTITGLSIANGATFWIRWNSFDATGADDGLAVDDFAITPQSSTIDLAITKSDGGVIVSPGGTVAYTLTYSNTGGQGATGVVISETVPTNTTFNAGASTPGWVCAPNNNAGSTCTLAVGSVSSGGNGAATFAVTVVNPVAAGVTQISNTAGISDDGTNGSDSNPGNNSASETTPVNAAPELTITKSDGGASVIPGGTIAYNLSYSNIGNQNATGVVITETVPTNTTFNAGASTPGWVCAPNNNAGSTCTLAVGNVAGGANGAATFAVTVANPVSPGVTEISNTATISDDGTNGSDPTPGNNSGSDVTPLSPTGDLDVFKFRDINRSGTFNGPGGETPVEGWEIKVFAEGADTDNDAPLYMGTTNMTGHVLFSGIPQGNYIVCEEVRSHWTITTGTVCRTVSVGAGTTNVEFANFENRTYIFRKVSTPATNDPVYFDWTLQNLNGADPGDLTVISDDPNGTVISGGPNLFTITELVPTGMKLVSVVCNGQEMMITDNSITFDTRPAETDVDCTFYNEPLPSCSDGIQNGNETGVDCGGPDCPACVSTGKIVVIKDVTTGSDPQDFSFNAYEYQPQFGLLAQFQLDDDADGTLSNMWMMEVSPGKYGVSEAGLANWKLNNIVCTSTDVNRQFPGISADPNNNGSGIAFDIAAGETITCTIENIATGDLSVFKLLDINRNGMPNIAGGESWLGGWEIKVFAQGADPKTATPLYSGFTATGTGNIIFEDIPQGTYLVCEEERSHWSITTGTICREVTVGAGTTETIFANFEERTYTFRKVSTPATNAPVYFDWTLQDLNGADPGDLTVISDDPNGTVISGGPNLFTITELVPTGMKLVSVVCNGQEMMITDNSITFDTRPAETDVDCTFYNEPNCPDPPATFSFTGDIQDWTVPDGVTSITIAAVGGDGGIFTTNSGANNITGAIGGTVNATLAVNPGDLIRVIVGGAAGSGEDGGGGGGGTAVINCGNPADCANGDILVVAGGGGGGSFGAAGGNASNTAGTGDGGAGVGGGGGINSAGGDDGTPNNGGGQASNTNISAGGIGGSGGSGGFGFGGGGSGNNGVGGGGGGYSGGSAEGGDESSGGGTSFAAAGATGVSFGGGIGGALNPADGSVTINYACPGSCTPPTINDEPDAVAQCTGGSASFTVAATASGTLSYQWMEDNANLSNGGVYSGVNTATLNISDVTGLNGKKYKVIVTNDNGTPNDASDDCSTTSEEVTLTVNPKPDITANATSTTICEGEMTTLNFTPTTDLTVVGWFLDDDDAVCNPMGGSLSTGTTFEVSPTSTTTYAVVVQNSDGCRDTACVTINVNPIPTATVTAISPICPGEDAVFTITATPNTSVYANLNGGSPFPSPFFASDSAKIGPSGMAIITIPNAMVNQTLSLYQVANYAPIYYQTSCRIVNINESATVVIGSNLNITAGATQTTICNGETTTLNFTPTTDITVVGWFLDDDATGCNPMGGSLSTGTTFEVSPTSTTTYAVVVEGSGGCRDTACVTITVLDPQAGTLGATNPVICDGGDLGLTHTGFSGANNFGTIAFRKSDGSFVAAGSIDGPNSAIEQAIEAAGPGEYCIIAFAQFTKPGDFETGACGINEDLIAFYFAPLDAFRACLQDQLDKGVCVDWDEFCVTVNPIPAGTISSNFSAICAGESIELRFTATVGVGPFDIVVNGTAYNDVVSGSVFATLSPNSNTDYTLTQITDNNGCIAANLSQAISVTVTNCQVTAFDPCTCKNNATTLTNGQFDETIQVMNAPTGQTWTVTAVNGLYDINSAAPPAAPTPIPVGTVLTESPAGSGTYILPGVHVDAQGYTISVSNGRGITFFLGNACVYPNPAITLDPAYCKDEPAVLLTGTPGDANILSESFKIDGNTATMFDPTALTIGNHTIEYTVDGGMAKASGPNDPGCIQTVSQQVRIDPQVTVDASNTQTICKTKTLSLSGLDLIITYTGGNLADLQYSWSIVEAGNNGTLTGMSTTDPKVGTYTPGADAIARGFVTLRLTVDNPNDACDAVSDTVLVNIQNVDCGTFPWNGNE